MQYVAIARFIVEIFGLLVELIKQIEAQFPDSDLGNMKREAVIKMLEGAVNTSRDVVGFDFEKAIPAVETTIGVIVGMFNKTGAFQTTKK